MDNTKGKPENTEGIIGFLSEVTWEKKHLSKGKNIGEKSASRKKESNPKDFDYLLKIPTGKIDIINLLPKHISDFDISSTGKTDYKNPKDYSVPDIVSNWSSYSVHKASEDEEPDHVHNKGKSSFLSMKRILMIFAIIMLACVLANASIALLVFLETPAGRTFSVLVCVVLVIWMRKKDWLPF